MEKVKIDEAIMAEVLGGSTDGEPVIDTKAFVEYLLTQPSFVLTLQKAVWDHEAEVLKARPGRVSEIVGQWLVTYFTLGFERAVRYQQLGAEGLGKSPIPESSPKVSEEEFIRGDTPSNDLN